MVFSTNNLYRKWFFRSTGALAIIILAIATADFAGGALYSTRPSLQTDTSYYETVTMEDSLVVLTFDDGPHPTRTDEILAVLKKHDVPATFFLLGSNALRHPHVVKRIQKAGFEIGNHTFTHSHEVHSSPQRIATELNVTNAILRSITGEETVLYRPPFLLDGGATTIIDTPQPVQEWVAGHGYVFAGADVDSIDWAATSPQQVVDNVLGEIDEGRLILLHDGAGGSVYTAEALDLLIPILKERGYRFGTASQALGVTPIVSAAPSPLLHLATPVALVPLVSDTGKVLFMLIKIALGLTVLRLIFIVAFTFIPKKAPLLAPWRRSVAVILPVYNEEENLAATLESLLGSSHPIGEIVVIDDGSRDQSASVARAIARQHPKRIRVIEQENKGKAMALMTGIRATSAEIVITMDGDTVFERHAIERLLMHFVDPAVGAAAGRVCVTRKPGLLNLFQHLEYTIGQQVEKPVFERFNAISIIPGPIGAWRREDLLAAGGFGPTTLVEDQDATLAILSLGKTVHYEPRAVSYTEPPHTVRDFLKQRLRWTFGTLQCLWRYREHFADTRRAGLGFIVLPNILVFGFGTSLLYPIADLIFLSSIVLGYWPVTLALYLCFTAVDMGYGLLGLRGEKDAYKLLPYLPLQRLFYRFAMYYVVARSLGRAIEGTGLLWEKVVKLGDTHLYRGNLGELNPRSQGING
jgi:cellulose synthase/poly-beta-1,6-N-acetylglucosamine synthase-like glycosyltransferase/peptidoglycan/xylan/chitin deacetylase (PgdA/CDA1 family)